jgi:lysophospholipase L1-like esterase
MTTVNRSAFGTGFLLALALAAALGASVYAVGGQQIQVRGLAAQGQAPAYLALGDSYPYGSDGSGFMPNNDNYWRGYPDFLHEMIDRPLINAGCPGETTASFLTGNPLDGGPMCPATKDAGLLHVDYQGAQIDFAEAYLTTHDRTVLITLQLGGNDFQDFVAQCGNSMACIKAGFPAFKAALAANFDSILARIRGTGYAGQMIFVPYPATKFNSPVAMLQANINQSMLPVALSYGVEMAPVFERFAVATQPYGGNSCTAGLLITNSDGTCNVHPTEAGHRLIASIIAEMVTGLSGPK